MSQSAYWELNMMVRVADFPRSVAREYEKVSDISDRGAFGVVYKIVNRKDRDQVFALKVIPRSNYLTADAEDILHSILENNRKIARVTRHPNLVKVEKVGSMEEPYIIMEYVPTERSLSDEFNPGRKYDPRRAADIILKIAQALEHVRGETELVAHGDVCPENILIDENGEPKLSDFDTALGLRTGRPHTHKDYEPWDATGHPSEEQLKVYDIFALGLIFLEMVSGQQPLKGEVSSPDNREKLVNDYVPPTLRNMVRNMVSGYDKRPSLDEAVTALTMFLSGRAYREDVLDILRAYLERLETVKRDLESGVPEENLIDEYNQLVSIQPSVEKMVREATRLLSDKEASPSDGLQELIGTLGAQLKVGKQGSQTI
jgi:serine/threonine protein kinase